MMTKLSKSIIKEQRFLSFSDVIFKTKATPAARQLALLVDVINQTVGDAISDLLLVECVLAAR